MANLRAKWMKIWDLCSYELQVIIKTWPIAKKSNLPLFRHGRKSTLIAHIPP